MATFLSQSQLYEAIQQKSKETKNVLYACSPNLGAQAHEIFSQEILRHLPADTRFVFRLNDAAVKAGEVNPFEAQFFAERFQSSSIRSLDVFHSNIYVFDDSALIASADLTKTALESNIECGVLLESTEAEETKRFFCACLWELAKPVKDLGKLKKLWSHERKVAPAKTTGKAKVPIRVEKWTSDTLSTWYFSILDETPKKAIRKIQKEANWPKQLELASDIGPNAFKQLKLGDMAFVANLAKKRGNEVDVRFVRVFDKSRVETDLGDLHFAYEVEKNFSIDRSQFYEILKNTGIPPKGSEFLLTQDQANQLTTSLSSTKPRKRRKAHKKPR